MLFSASLVVVITFQPEIGVCLNTKKIKLVLRQRVKMQIKLKTVINLDCEIMDVLDTVYTSYI